MLKDQGPAMYMNSFELADQMVSFHFDRESDQMLQYYILGLLFQLNRRIIRVQFKLFNLHGKLTD